MAARYRDHLTVLRGGRLIAEGGAAFGALLLWLTDQSVVWLGAVLVLVGVGLSLTLGRNAESWHWAHGEEMLRLLPWRWPRTLAAQSAGVMLATAGTLIQKLTANPMGSPGVLGISAGASGAVILVMLLIPGDAFAWQLPASSLGAALTLGAIILVSGRRHFSPQRMLLAGIAIGTAFTTLITLLLLSGDPRLGDLLSWISGSTYGIGPQQAVFSAVTAFCLLLVPLCRRYLTLLPMGSALSLGVPLVRVRLSILLLAAVMTAGATLTVGPLSFIGLMAPHMARMLGFHKPLAQGLMASAIEGGHLDDVRRLVRSYGDVSEPNSRRLAGDLYRHALFYLAAASPDKTGDAVRCSATAVRRGREQIT